MNQYLPQIFENIFQSTLNMIQSSMDQFPDHRYSFFKFLYSVTNNCFLIIIQMNNEQLTLIIQCILWGIEHIDTNICDTSIKTTELFLKNIKKLNNYTIIFYQNYLFQILEKLFNVMTDTLHKSIFPDICKVLYLIFNDIQQININFNQNNNNSKNQNDYIANQIQIFLNNKFNHLTNDVINNFILGLFKITNNNNNNNNNQNYNIFIKHCNDFLIQIKKIHHVNNNNNNNNMNNNNNNNMNNQQNMNNGNNMNNGR